jgi:hypothetical protein
MIQEQEDRKDRKDRIEVERIKIKIKRIQT